MLGRKSENYTSQRLACITVVLHWRTHLNQITNLNKNIYAVLKHNGLKMQRTENNGVETLRNVNVLTDMNCVGFMY